MSSTDADSIRIFPPSLATVTIPKWASRTSDQSLAVVMLPRDQWREKWDNKMELPLIMDFSEDTTPTVYITNSGRAADSDPELWRATVAVETPPWAVNNELADLAHEQLFAIREWHEKNEIHPMAALTKSASARMGANRIGEPQAWRRWLGSYSQGTIDYGQLVERVYYDFSNGNFPRWAGQRPKLAKTSSDWVRRRFKSMGMTPGRLRRYWWRNVSYQGES